MPNAPPSTPLSEDSTTDYYGWYSPVLQQMRVSYPPKHRFNGKIMKSPPYMYWTLHGNENVKVLVTEVTHTSVPTSRQVKNGDIYVGRLDKYWGKSYVFI